MDAGGRRTSTGTASGRGWGSPGRAALRRRQGGCMSVHQESTGPGQDLQYADEYAALMATVDDAMAQAHAAVEHAAELTEAVSAVRGRGVCDAVTVTVGPTGRLLTVEFGGALTSNTPQRLSAATVKASDAASRDAEAQVARLTAHLWGAERGGH